MKQLDLFGFWQEDEQSAVPQKKGAKNVLPASYKEEPPANHASPAEVVPDLAEMNGMEMAPVEELILAARENDNTTPLPAMAKDETVAAPAFSASSIVFEDDKIAVKVKLKQQAPVPVEATATVIATEAPAAILPEKRPLLVVVKKRGRKSFKEIDAEINLVEVPEDEVLFQKQYYAISQVATWFHVNTSLIRYWENEFDILKPRKNRKGDRLFRPEDVKSLQVIYYLLRQRKFSIEGAKKYLKENRKNADTNVQLIQS